jgi:hypothetical protein
MHQSRKAIIDIFLLERYYARGVKKVRRERDVVEVENLYHREHGRNTEDTVEIAGGLFFR